MNDSGRFIRIGPLSLFALIAMLFLSTLAVLSITTANASYNLGQLQADGMEQQYDAEAAAQTFLSLVDSQYSSATITAQRDATERATAERASRATRDAASAANDNGADSSSAQAAPGSANASTQQQDAISNAGDGSLDAQKTREIAESSARSAASSISSSIEQLAIDAAASVSSDIVATAQINGSTITAQFACPNGRVLDIEVELGSGGTFRVIKWNMSAKVNSAEPEMLWSGM